MNISVTTIRNLSTFNNSQKINKATQIRAVIEPVLKLELKPEDIRNAYENIFNSDSPLSKKNQAISREQIYAAVQVYTLCQKCELAPSVITFSCLTEHVEFFNSYFTDLLNTSNKTEIKLFFDEITTEQITFITDNQGATYGLTSIRNIGKNNTSESLYQGDVEKSPNTVLEKAIEKLRNEIDKFNCGRKLRNKRRENDAIDDSKEDYNEIEYKNIGESEDNNIDNEYKEDNGTPENEVEVESSYIDNLSKDAYKNNENNANHIDNSSISSTEVTKAEITTLVANAISITLKTISAHSISYNSYLNRIKCVLYKIKSTNDVNIIYDIPNYIYILFKILAEETYMLDYEQVSQIAKKMIKQFILKDIYQFEKVQDLSSTQKINKMLSFAIKYLDEDDLREIYIIFTTVKLKLEIYEFDPLKSIEIHVEDVIQFLKIIESNIEKEVPDLTKTKKLITYIAMSIKANALTHPDIPQKLKLYLNPIISALVTSYTKFIDNGELNVVNNESSFYDCHYLLSLNIAQTNLLDKLLTSTAKQLENIILSSSTMENMDIVYSIPSKLLKIVLYNINADILTVLINNMYNLYTANSDIEKITICRSLVDFIKITAHILPKTSTENIWEMINYLNQSDPYITTDTLLEINTIKFIPTDILTMYYYELIELSPNYDYYDYNHIIIIKREAQIRRFSIDVVFPPLRLGSIQHSNQIALYQVHNELNKLIAPLRLFIQAIMNFYHTEIIFDLTTNIDPKIIIDIQNQLNLPNQIHDSYMDILIYLNHEITRLFANDEDNRKAANAVLNYLLQDQNSATTQFFADMRFIISFLHDSRPAWVKGFSSQDSRIMVLIQGLIQSASAYGTVERAIETRISCHRGIYERVIYELTQLTTSITIFANTYARCQVKDSIYTTIKNKLVSNENGTNEESVNEFIRHIAEITSQITTDTITFANIRDTISNIEIEIHTQEITSQLNDYNNRHADNDIPPKILEQHINRLWNETVEPSLKQFLLETLDTMIELSAEESKDEWAEDPYNFKMIKNMAIEIHNKNNTHNF